LRVICACALVSKYKVSYSVASDGIKAANYIARKECRLKFAFHFLLSSRDTLHRINAVEIKPEERSHGIIQLSRSIRAVFER
jgi:hypothetical protein